MKASSESGECASLISTGSFSVFEAVCWPGMGVSVSSSSATPARPGHSMYNCKAAASTWCWFLPERLSHRGRVYRRRTEENCASLGRAISCNSKPSILMSREQLERARRRGEKWLQVLQRRDHTRDGVVEGSRAVKVRLPEFLQ